MKSFSKAWKDAFLYASSIMAFMAAVLQVIDCTLSEMLPSVDWLSRLLLILAIYLAFVVCVRIGLHLVYKKGITITVRGIPVKVKAENLFDTTGWKLIPFNEYFDTAVDDAVISSQTLNGMFIEQHVSDIEDLRAVISSSISTHGERTKSQLGTIIPYNREYMLLAFSHFNENNEAHLSKSEYETCLLNMWKEIRRTYANRPVNIPLIGSGITSFDDVSQKSNFDLLKCMICTLNVSGISLNQPINIVLTPETFKSINIYEVKGLG